MSPIYIQLYYCSAGPCQSLLSCFLWWPDNVLTVWTERWQNHHFTDDGWRGGVIAYVVTSGVWVFSLDFHLWVSDMPGVCGYSDSTLLPSSPLQLTCVFTQDPGIFWRPVAPDACVSGTSKALSAPTGSELPVCCVQASGMNQTFLRPAMLLLSSLGRLDSLAGLGLLSHDMWFCFTWSV